MAWREREGYDQGEDWWNQPDVPQTAQPPQQSPAEQLGAVRETPGGSPPQTREQEPWWWDYNGGSPPAVPLGGGMQDWNWDGTRWWQIPGGGAPPPPPPPPRPDGPAPTPPPTGGSGSVPSIGGGGVPGGSSAPSATLPADISALFNTQPTKTPIQSAYQDALLKFMGRAQEPPSLADPTLAPQVEVFRAANQRNTERQRRVAAERASATGQSQSGYLDNLIGQGVQQQGFNNAQYNANLLGGELDKRRQELQAALQLARASGDSEAQRELQTRLAQVSAMMQQQGLNLQGQLGFGDLALRQRQTELGNNQFYDQLGVNSALNLEGLNQRALQMIMGGL